VTCGRFKRDIGIVVKSKETNKTLRIHPERWIKI
jgi:hypothetical protein